MGQAASGDRTAASTTRLSHFCYAPAMKVHASNALVIVNPASGRDNGARIQELLRNRLASDGCGCVQRLTTGAGDAAAWAAGAGMEGFDLVIAVGGDGTLAEVVGGMCKAQRRVPIAYVPAGSANLAARALGIESAADAAVETVATGVAVPFDVGVLPERDRYFLVAAAIGYPASLVRDAPRALKKRFGFLAYLIGALRNAGHVVRPERFEIETEYGRRVYRAHTVVVMNTSVDLGIPMLPSANPHDGRLDITVMTTRNWWGVLRVLVAALLRRPHNAEVIQFSAKRVRITAHPAHPIHLDGEMVGPTPVLVEVLPAAVELVLPAPQADRPTGGAVLLASVAAAFQRSSSGRAD